jgi:hypothetical protein
MIGRLLIMQALLVAPAVSTMETAPGPERYRLDCAGTLQGADPAIPPSSIAADGIVDLGKRRVDGFGIGRSTIIRVSDREIGFGRENGTEGVIARATGAVDIRVRAGDAASRPLISIHLDCRRSAPVS